MVKKMKQSECSKKIMAGVMGASLILGTLGGFAVSELTQKPIIEKVIVPKIVEKEVIVEVPVIETVTEEKIVNQTVEVEVDNGDLEMVLVRLEDMNVFDDAKEIVEEIKAEDVARGLAEDKIREELADDDFVEDELVDQGFIEDEDEFSITKIYNDYDQVDITESDFDDDEYEFVFKVKLEDEEADEYVKLYFTVSVENGKAKIKDIN